MLHWKLKAFMVSITITDRKSNIILCQLIMGDFYLLAVFGLDDAALPAAL